MHQLTVAPRGCHCGISRQSRRAEGLAEEQSEDGWRPVMGRFWVAEAGIGCRGALEQNTEQAERRSR